MTFFVVLFFFVDWIASLKCTDADVFCVPADHATIGDAIDAPGGWPRIIALTDDITESVVIDRNGGTGPSSYSVIRTLNSTTCTISAGSTPVIQFLDVDWWRVESPEGTLILSRTEDAGSSYIIHLDDVWGDGIWIGKGLKFSTSKADTTIVFGMDGYGDGHGISGVTFDSTTMSTSGSGSYYSAIYLYDAGQGVPSSYGFVWTFQDITMDRELFYGYGVIISSCFLFSSLTDDLQSVIQNYIVLENSYFYGSGTEQFVYLGNTENSIVRNNVFDQRGATGNRQMLYLSDINEWTGNVVVSNNYFQCNTLSTDSPILIYGQTAYQNVDFRNNIFDGCVSATGYAIDVISAKSPTGSVWCHRYSSTILGDTDDGGLSVNNSCPASLVFEAIPIAASGKSDWRTHYSLTEELEGENMLAEVPADASGMVRNLPMSVGPLEFFEEITCHGIQKSNTSYVCSGNGYCDEEDVCVCVSDLDWLGNRCQIPACGGIAASNETFVCSGRGTCTNHSCECDDAWENRFDFCDDFKCEGGVWFDGGSGEVCSGHGDCNETHVECVCEAGWVDQGGNFCNDYKCEDGKWQFANNDTVCGGRGNSTGCLPTNETCLCVGRVVNRFGGYCNDYQCEDLVWLSEGGYCGGHGACNATSAACACDSGWYDDADICDNFKCEDGNLNGSAAACGGRGWCTFSDDACVCDFGWFDDADICDNFKCEDNRLNGSALGCGGHGLCSFADDTCVCDFGWYDDADFCDNFKCADGNFNGSAIGCGGHGWCTSVTDDACVCDFGWYDDDGICDNFKCVDGNLNGSAAACSGHGSCSFEDPSCSCVTDPSPLPDWGHDGGYCNNFYCEDGPFNGSSSACGGHGWCTATDERCVCDFGWYHDGGICNNFKCEGGELNGSSTACNGHGFCTFSNPICECEYPYESIEGICNDFRCEDGLYNFNGSACGGGNGGCQDDNKTCTCKLKWKDRAARCDDYLCEDGGWGIHEIGSVCGSHGGCDETDDKCDCLGRWVNQGSLFCNDFRCEYGNFYNAQPDLSCGSPNGHCTEDDPTCFCDDGYDLATNCTACLGDLTLESDCTVSSNVGDPLFVAKVVVIVAVVVLVVGLVAVIVLAIVVEVILKSRKRLADKEALADSPLGSEGGGATELKETAPGVDIVEPPKDPKKPKQSEDAAVPQKDTPSEPVEDAKTQKHDADSKPAEKEEERDETEDDATKPAAEEGGGGSETDAAAKSPKKKKRRRKRRKGRKRTRDGHKKLLEGEATTEQKPVEEVVDEKPSEEPSAVVEKTSDEDDE